MDGYKTLKAGQTVSFELEDGPKGMHAINIQSADSDAESSGEVPPEAEAETKADAKAEEVTAPSASASTEEPEPEPEPLNGDEQMLEERSVSSGS